MEAKKEIHGLVGNIILFPSEVTAETDRSYIAFSGEREYAYPKDKFGKEWFWSHEDAKAFLESQSEIRQRIRELQNLLV